MTQFKIEILFSGCLIGKDLLLTFKAIEGLAESVDPLATGRGHWWDLVVSAVTFDAFKLIMLAQIDLIVIAYRFLSL